MVGAKWIGLDESKIESIEEKYGITFTPEHKAFLKILHTIDRKRPVEYYNENDELFIKNEPYFYNWLLKIVGLAISVVGGGKIGNYIGRIVTRNEKGGVVRTNKKL